MILDVVVKLGAASEPITTFKLPIVALEALLEPTYILSVAVVELLPA